MFLLILFIIYPNLLFSESLPSPIPKCSGVALSGKVCGSGACADTRCLTCSEASASDCLLCDNPYNLVRFSGFGSCVMACNSTQVDTDHYNNTVFSVNSDICLDSTQNCTDMNCLSCLKGSPNLCLICNNSMYPSYNATNGYTTCKYCIGSIMNCMVCAWNSYCYNCNAYGSKSAGFLLNNDGSVCLSCQKAISHCGKCDGQNACIACDKGYFLLNGKCASCLRNCDICPDKKTCTTCKSGYYNTGGTNCTLCSQPLKNCLSCTDSSTCQICKASYYLDSFTSPTVCKSCFDANMALKCNGTNIIKCADNTTLSQIDNICYPCNHTSHCAYCDGTRCLVCGPGYLIASNLSGCISDSTIPYCMKSDGKYCIKCLPGFYIEKNASNVWCEPCTSINNSNSCDGQVCNNCTEDYYLLGTKTCLPCSNVSNCSKCDGINCVMCNDGFFIHNDGGAISCVLCADPVLAIDKCKRCWDQNTCKKCDSGYLLDDHLKCKSIFSVKNCLSTDGISCTSCYKGYYLWGGGCVKCTDENCEDCTYNAITTNSPCSKCRQGYYLNPLTSICISCSGNYNGTYCQLCDYSLDNISNNYNYKCSKCIDGYGVIIGVNSCTFCSLPNCLQCIYDPIKNKYICDNCASGYYLESYGNCSYCGDSHCTTCNKTEFSLTCTACNSGYYLNSSKKCAPCANAGIGCAECSVDENLEPICSKCIDSTYFFNDTTNNCVPCNTLVASCSKCANDISSNSILCFSCNNNYYLQNTTLCTKCQSDLCNTCSGFDFGKSCSVCKSGYYVKNSSCDICSNAVSGCKSCSKDSSNGVICSQCLSAFYLNKTKNCVTCSSFCQNCSDHDHCYSCSNGYYSQINKTGSYCLSSNCDPPISIANKVEKTCELCSDLFDNCSECNTFLVCSRCRTGNFMMLPYLNSCSLCNDSLHQIINGSFCAFVPYVADPITRSVNALTYSSFYSIDCSINQTIYIYGVFFIHYDNYLDNIDFYQDVKSVIDNNISEITSNLSLINRSSTDRYWTTYFAITSNYLGKVMNIMFPEFMNANINYRMYVWCYNKGNSHYPLNITSKVSYLDWIQDDNQGKTIKISFFIELTLNEIQRASLAIYLSDMLGLSKIKRTIIYDVIPDSETQRLRRILADAYYEYFYVKRDFTILPIDNTNNGILAKLKGTDFLKTLNLKASASGFSINNLTYIELNSTFQFVVPNFKSVDFPSILVTDNISASFNISIINTNSMIYVGIVKDVNADTVDWLMLMKGLVKEDKSFDNFQKIYLKVQEVWQWKVNNLEAGSSYVIFIGAINEDEYLSAMKTKVYRVVFKTKLYQKTKN